MQKLIIVVAILALAAGSAPAKVDRFQPPDDPVPERVVWLWYDDLETGGPGWTHGDYTVSAIHHFHVDQYLAYAGDYSWWCGNFDYDADGGYGNSWNDYLVCDPVDWTDCIYPVLTFAYRNDTEPGYDFSFVDAESNCVWTHLNRGYDGVHPWTTTGFFLGNIDNPAHCRFNVVTDGAFSDADGGYDSYGGAFMCDNISIYDYYGGDPLLLCDAEAPPYCCRPLGAQAGDYWHIIEDDCKAESDPHVWVNTEEPAENFVPPNVQNWLRTPVVDVSGVTCCTLRFDFQFFTPALPPCPPGLSYWVESIIVDGGPPIQLAAWWGDQCDQGYDPCHHFHIEDDLSGFLPANTICYEWTYYSTAYGTGPDICNSAGLTLDNIGFENCEPVSAAEGTSWGRVKALYR